METVAKKRFITVGGQKIDYILKISGRATCLRILIKPGGEMTAIKPRFLNESAVEDFLRQKSVWIIEKIKQLSQVPANSLWQADRKEYLAQKNKARRLAEQKIIFFNRYYNFNIRRISIRDQSSRWGSCSRKGNLNFNYRIALIPEHLADYVVVHELCHLGQLNHSCKFWDLVKMTLPDFAARRKELKSAYR